MVDHYDDGGGMPEEVIWMDDRKCHTCA